MNSSSRESAQDTLVIVADSSPGSELTVGQLFARQVERAGGNTALVYQQRSFSYCQLDAMANRLAADLLTHGAGLGKIVALLNDEPIARTICMVACKRFFIACP